MFNWFAKFSSTHWRFHLKENETGMYMNSFNAKLLYTMCKTVY